MKRNSTIASVAAATGIAAATVIAAISLMQATVTDGSENETITLAAATATLPAPTDLVFTPEPLPEIPVISNSAAPTSSEAQASGQQVSATSADQVNRNFATKAVVNATNGKVTGVETLTYKGFDAFAVTVKRTDGSVVTGYVDRSSGDIYEWVVVKEAPAPVKQYEEDEYEEDEYEEDEHEEDEYEEDERENDDD